MCKYLKESKQLITITIPIVLAQITQTSMGFVDTLIASKLSAIDMSAIVIGTSIWWPIILFGHGLLLALTPIISYMHGSKNIKHMFSYVKHSYYLATFSALIIMILLWYSEYLIHTIHQIEPSLAKKSSEYLKALMWGVPGYLYFQIIKNQCEGLSKPKIAMLISFIGLLINIILNYILVYGNTYIPSLGCVGSGIATAIVYWIMFFIIKFWTHKSLSRYYSKNHKNSYKFPDKKVLFQLMKIGFPIAASLFFEVVLFSVITILISSMGLVQILAHQIVLNFSSLIFVIPLSLGAASTIRIGLHVGEKSESKINISIWSIYVIGIIIAIIESILIFLFRDNIASLYSSNPTIITISKKILVIAAIYQCLDFIQVIGNGILRGYKDT
ncbi:MATE family efflux transporter, partial [Buchnera aphidicola (Hormaphis cornu)]